MAKIKRKHAWIKIKDFTTAEFAESFRCRKSAFCVPILEHVSGGSGKASCRKQSIYGRQRPLLARSAELQERRAVLLCLRSVKDGRPSNDAVQRETLLGSYQKAVLLHSLKRKKKKERKEMRMDSIFSCLQGFFFKHFEKTGVDRLCRTD